MNSSMIEQRLKGILADVLGLSATRLAALGPGSGLFGTMPELDSMAVAGLLTEVEDRFEIIIDDEDVDGEMLASFGGLMAYIGGKAK